MIDKQASMVSRDQVKDQLNTIAAFLLSKDCPIVDHDYFDIVKYIDYLSSQVRARSINSLRTRK